tara:strand:- start:947 stop:1471 length:525 start_codon:yes stop_codon:yes gene_type:complete
MDLAYANAKVPSLANVKSHADDLDDYLERLYDDDMNTRVSATAHIAALARRVENLPVLLGHDTLVQTLARVLREEGRKSVDLATNVVSVFFAFSNYTQFHAAILENQMGDATMRIIDLEVKRQDDRWRRSRNKASWTSSPNDGWRWRSESRINSCTRAFTCCSTCRRTRRWSAR